MIDALQWEGGKYTCLEDFCGLNWGRADAHAVPWNAPADDEQVVLWNQIEKQWICCPVGWLVIRGIKGELYPCSPDIFAATYEEVND